MAGLELRHIVAAIPKAIFACTLEGQIRLWNPAASSLFEYEPDEVIGRSFEVLIPAERLMEERGLLAELIEGRATGPYRTTRARKSGSRFQASVDSSPVLDDTGRIKGIVTFTREVKVGAAPGERSRLATQASPSGMLIDSDGAIALAKEQRFRELAEAVPQIVWTCGTDGLCDYLNSRWVEYTGISQVEQLGLGWSHQLHPADRERVTRQWSEAISRGTAVEMEYRLRRYDGVYHWFKTVASPHRDQQGSIVKWYGSSTDIQDLRDAQHGLQVLNLELEQRVAAAIEELKTANARLEILASQLQEAQRIAKLGSWEWQQADDSLSWSPELYEIFGLDPKNAPPSSAERDKRYHPSSLAILDEAIREALERGVGYKLELRALRADESSRWILARGEPMRDQNGRTIGLHGTAQDVTELKIAQEQLERSNRDLEQFASAASHDLHEPLRAVSGCAQILQSRYGARLDDQADNLIAHIVDGAARMQTLINDLLSYARVERGGSPAPVESGQALEQALLLLTASIEESRANILYDRLPTVRSDLSQLKMLFANLVGNALKYRGGTPPRVRIAADRVNGFWEFRVADNGIGIPPSHHSRIFLLFQRLHTREEYPGTGIGLALCHRIVHRHGGRIWVDSSGADGSVFKFTLPAAD